MAQSSTEIAKITVPARCRKTDTRCHTVVRSTRMVGFAYAGISIIRARVSERSSVRRNTAAAASAATVPSRYIASNASPCSVITCPIVTAGTNAEISSAYTGSRAEQLISGTTIIVASRSLVCGIVRVAMIAGTAHA